MLPGDVILYSVCMLIKLAKFVFQFVVPECKGLLPDSKLILCLLFKRTDKLVWVFVCFHMLGEACE